MKVPFTWRPAGWYQIGWSQDFIEGSATPLHYFGEDLVAYRGVDGDLRVLEDRLVDASPDARRARATDADRNASAYPGAFARVPRPAMWSMVARLLLSQWPFRDPARERAPSVVDEWRADYDAGVDTREWHALSAGTR